ncbi:hypothetical protein WN51_02327 [Melipona quadrifasciata]|uniref:Uncharacterized protein n=1 Tax=Melipona quadrifasciata TaxID=166423 RepID=A0A0M8ZVF5_9HYME|nr:hypothetical protein WN51_02327 [Melipona quadrifasciata]
MYITYKRNVGVGLLCTRRSDKNLSALNINGEKTVQESQQWCTSKTIGCSSHKRYTSVIKG